MSFCPFLCLSFSTDERFRLSEIPDDIVEVRIAQVVITKAIRLVAMKSGEPDLADHRKIIYEFQRQVESGPDAVGVKELIPQPRPLALDGHPPVGREIIFDRPHPSTVEVDERQATVLCDMGIPPMEVTMTEDGS